MSDIVFSLLGILWVLMIVQAAVPGTLDHSSVQTIRRTQLSGKPKLEVLKLLRINQLKVEQKKWKDDYPVDPSNKLARKKKFGQWRRKTLELKTSWSSTFWAEMGSASLGLKAPGLSLYLGINFTRGLHWFNYRKTEPIDSFSWLQVNLQKNGTKPALDFIQAKSAKEPSQGQNQRCYG